ncbi:GNAT family N-acetyltransferase [Paraburkholderia sp.]|uniref:GNAT family N-acetyltransferase n=1 Tax=Paraburkholderia sp. TaxID=1926495 RepID=UPI003D6F90F4
MARDIIVRQLGIADLDAYFQLRLRGLAEHPEAFGKSYAEALASGPEQYRPTLEGRTADEGRFILGASLEDSGDGTLREGALVGTVGLIREQNERGRHKASVVAMYVASEAAGRGVGRALLEALLARAARVDGLRQVQLVVSSTNLAARGLYESLGFVAYGHERESMRVGDTFYDADLMAYFL